MILCKQELPAIIQIKWLQDAGIRPRDQQQLLIHAQRAVDDVPLPLREGFPLVKSGRVVGHGESTLFHVSANFCNQHAGGDEAEKCATSGDNQQQGHALWWDDFKLLWIFLQVCNLHF